MEDAKIVYGDIIDHPHHRSAKRTHMSLYDRAAQFSAYDALAGYYDMIAEEARITDAERELDENAKELLNQKLSLVAEEAEQGRRPLVRFTVFVPDERKAGGRYEEIPALVKQIDPVHRCVVLEEKTGRAGQNRTIPLERITAIHGDAVDALDALS